MSMPGRVSLKFAAGLVNLIGCSCDWQNLHSVKDEGVRLESILFIADVAAMVYLVYWTVRREEAAKAEKSQIAEQG